MKRIAQLIGGMLTLLVAGVAPAHPAPSFNVQISGAGKPVVLVPGLACSAEVWDETVKHLNAEGYRTYALTLPGFGGQPAIKTDDYLATVQNDIVQYIHDQHIDKPVLIGHSLGGFLVLKIAAENPDLPSKVISVDGLPFLAAAMMPNVTPEMAKQIGERTRLGILNGDPQHREERSRATLTQMVTSPSNVDRELKVESKSDTPTVAAAMGELLATDIRPEMKNIKVPVLELGTWIAYKNYGATHDSVQQKYTAQFGGNPNVHVVISDTARHFIQLDDQPWFFSQIDAFLKP